MSTETLLDDLREILDRLGPGLELRVELSVLRAFFVKIEHGSQSIEIVEQRALAFADENECGFVYDPTSETGAFIRAYPKRLEPQIIERGYTFHIRPDIADKDLPVEYMMHAFSSLEGAERLNALMLKGEFEENYYRGLTVLWLSYHSVELFLKGCILKHQPNYKFDSHSTPVDLTKALVSLDPEFDFDPPFKAEVARADGSLLDEAKKEEKVLHVVFRYPAKKDGERWRGVRAFSAALAQSDLDQIRMDFERHHERMFGLARPRLG
jgi:hypothetical protein